MSRVAKMRGTLFFFLYIINAFATLSHAADLLPKGVFRAESASYFSSQQNSNKEQVSPFYEFLSATYMTSKRDFVIESDLSFFNGATENSVANSTSSKNVQVHILDIKKEVIPNFLSLRAGRTLGLENTLGSSSVDLLQADLYFLNKQIRWGTFVGSETPTEKTGLVTQQEPTTSLWGTQLQYYTNEVIPSVFNVKFHQRTEPQSYLHVENYLDLSAKKSFVMDNNPDILFESRTNLTQSHTDRVETAFNFYPSLNSHSQIRFSEFDLLPTTGRQSPIYSIFAFGPLLETRFLWESKISSKWISSISLFYDDYLLQEGGVRAQGQGVENEWRNIYDAGIIGHSVYYFKSYGGYAVGYRLNATYQVENKDELYFVGDLTYYEKITTSHRSAVSSALGWSRMLNRQWKLSLGSELNSNNTLLYDFRVLAKLLFVFWSET